MITGFIAATRGIDSKGEKLYATCAESNGSLLIALTVFLISWLLGGWRTPPKLSSFWSSEQVLIDKDITGFKAAAQGIDSKGEKVYASCDESSGGLSIALTVFLISRLLGGPGTLNFAGRCCGIG